MNLINGWTAGNYLRRNLAKISANDKNPFAISQFVFTAFGMSRSFLQSNAVRTCIIMTSNSPFARRINPKIMTNNELNLPKTVFPINFECIRCRWIRFDWNVIGVRSERPGCGGNCLPKSMWRIKNQSVIVESLLWWHCGGSPIRNHHCQYFRTIISAACVSPMRHWCGCTIDICFCVGETEDAVIQQHQWRHNDTTEYTRIRYKNHGSISNGIFFSSRVRSLLCRLHDTPKQNNTKLFKNQKYQFIRKTKMYDRRIWRDASRIPLTINWDLKNTTTKTGHSSAPTKRLQLFEADQNESAMSSVRRARRRWQTMTA